MRSDMIPGAAFPDYQLTDHTVNSGQFPSRCAVRLSMLAAALAVGGLSAPEPQSSTIAILL